MKGFLFFGIVLLLFLSGCTQLPVCGNGICESGEDVVSCLEDCGLEQKGCVELGGFVCGGKEFCSDEQIDSFDGEVCCSIECETLIDEKTPHKCDTGRDCDDNDNRTNDFCKGYPRKCVHEFKSCLEIGGQVCDSNSFCEGELVNAKDEPTCCVGSCEQKPICDILNCASNEKCVAGRCVLKTCEEQGGVACILPEECVNGPTPSSNVTICCPVEECKKLEVIKEPTCGLDEKCKLDCVGGDPDCSCEEQNGIIVHDYECPYQMHIKATDAIHPLQCCPDPLVLTNCVDSDEGINYEVKGSCVATGVTESGQIIEINSFTDSCGSYKRVSDSYCEQLTTSHPENTVPIYHCVSVTKQCTFCSDGTCLNDMYEEDNRVLEDGEVLTGLLGDNSLEGQTVSVQFELALVEDGESTVYRGNFTLFDEQGAEVQSLILSTGDYLNENFVGSDGLPALKTGIYINLISLNREADLSILYIE